MTPYIHDADFTLYVGDIRNVISQLPDSSVDCVVTSPPYWGLRDYGTSEWEGGSDDCDHAHPKAGDTDRNMASSTLDGAAQSHRHNGPANQCRKCGATRTDRQLGMEGSPEEYVAAMVDVFREVWRVLAPHGTVWLNLGSSYFSEPPGGGGPNGKNESRWSYGRASRRGVQPRDTSCTELQGSPDPGSACLDLCDECADDLTIRTARTHPPAPVVASPDARTDPDTSLQGSESAQPARAVQASTTPGSSPQPPVVCWRCGIREASVSLRVLPPSSPDAQASAHTEASTNGTSPHGSEHRNQNTDASGMAWVNYSRRLKPKDLVPIPWMVAMALQMDGWYLRAEIIWAKKNCMPESVTDRPTKSHEQIFLLTKGPRYWFDQEAVREPWTTDRMPGQRTNETQHYGAGNGGNGGLTAHRQPFMAAMRDARRPQDETLDGSEGEAPRGPDGRRQTGVQAGDGSIQHRDGERWPNGGRNIRSVWEIATQPYAGAHFATFPEELPRRAIKAGCPEWVCRVCGKPRERIVESTSVPVRPNFDGVRGALPKSEIPGQTLQMARAGNTATATVGWSGCGHGDYRPGVVLDPFMGAGTTALVARKLARHSVGIELNQEYAELARRRLQQLSLFA